MEIINFLTSAKNIKSMVIIIMAIIIVVYSSILLVVPKWRDFIDLLEKTKESEVQLESYQQKLDAKRREEKLVEKKTETVPVEVYKSPLSNLPVESSSIDLVTNVISMLEKNNNNIINISYTPNPAAVNEMTVPVSVGVVELKLKLDSTYVSLKNFLTTLYSYNYLCSVKAMRIVPFQDNKNMLDVDIIIWVYVMK
ncbi:MAG: hypothetical protein PHX18_07795 [Candidatus Gastranaerophilales bacterium]|nr:hypothetical protein [Candidatus Gastranaerophilales bacterium]